MDVREAPAALELRLVAVQQFKFAQSQQVTWKGNRTRKKLKALLLLGIQDKGRLGVTSRFGHTAQLRPISCLDKGQLPGILETLLLP